MTSVQEQDAEEAESTLVSAVVRIKGPDGAIGGAGFLVAPDQVLTCAHVVSDALGRPRDALVDVGTEVTVDLPLAETPDGGDDGGDGSDGRDGSAAIQHWIPIRPDQTGDIAVLRLRNPIPGARPLPMADPRHGVWDHEARTVGFTDDAPDGIWQSGRFRGPTRQGWIQLSRADGEAVYVKGGFSGSPVWDERLGVAVGMMVAAQPVREAQQAFVLRVRTLLKEVPELAPYVSPSTPFRGLATFQEDDADVFFGRDDDIERVVAALRGDHPVVTVYGPSGCGKSSLALAGVAPRMRRDGYRVLTVNAVRFASLRTALATELFEVVRSGQDGPPRAGSADQVESWLTELGLTDTVQRALGPAAGKLLVVLDQAEALLDRSEDVAEEVADLLFPERRQDGVRVLVTLRADFMDAALNHPRLGSALKSGVTVPLTPMSRDQLEKVIGEPVRRVPAVEYEPGLERRILDDAGGEPGILPLLGFVLAQLWDQQAGGRLRTSTYEENGGVSGALRRHAERAWSECVPNEEAGETAGEALRLLTGLVRVLPGSEAPLRRMLTREEAGETRWRIATSLASRRLLVLHGEEGGPQSVELAHEALISAWPTLARQVKADAEFLAGRAELAHDLDRWQKADRPPDLLPGAPHLLALSGRLHGREAELSSEERAFLDLARRRHRARRHRSRAAWTAAALVLALIAALGTFLVQQSRVSAQRQAEARSRSLASLSDDLTKRDPGLSALVAIAAYDIEPTQEARNALLRRYDQFHANSWVMTGTESPIEDMALSTDGAVALVTTAIGSSLSGKSGAVLFVRRAGGRIHREPLRLAQQVLHPLVSRDGRRIAYLSAQNGGTLVWHDVNRDAENVLGPPHTIRHGDFGDIPMTDFGQEIGLADFSPDGGDVVMLVDGRARIWDLATRTGRGLPARVPTLGRVWFGPDGRTLVAQAPSGPDMDADSSVIAVDTDTGRTRELASGVSTSVRPRLALSGDGAVLAFCRVRRGEEGATYRAVRVVDGRVLTTYLDALHRDCDRGLAMDRRGHYFAVRVTAAEWAVVDTRPGKGAKKAFGPSEISNTLDLPLVQGPEGPVLVTWDETAVTGRTLTTGDTFEADSPPVLLGNGSTTLAREGAHGDALALARMEEDGETTTLKKVKRPARDQSKDRLREPPEIKVNPAQTLAADLVGPHTIRVWELPSLRTVRDITTVRSPVDKAGKPTEDVELTFLADDELLTLSGTRIEHWNARTGERLSEPIDVRDLGLTGTDPPQFTLDPYPKPGHVQIMIKGSPVVHALDLRTGKEDTALRLRFDPVVDHAVLDGSGRYAVVKNSGNMVEVWSVRAGRPGERVLGPLGPLQAYGRYRMGFLRDSSEFFLANENSIRIQKPDGSGEADSYEFEQAQEFLAASRDGRTLLRLTDDSRVDLLRLDPGLWKDRLCHILGRDVSEDERQGLPTWLPREVCPG
ncbi:trypsin-like peptidase domain-containing protein [Streptomyces sp. ISL-36]|uniref:nSTAND1 domain-containing NTPase n=1 Tax=Streptomyces sp. ISL-36 TaxID=2819182 RepID=UPI001BE6F500|nr:serine protease [Streptomyces sp. ISL-36]MBT2439163.1 trypsin-like peptidase domain-containing protein [Streptomyces sp. ISL-36]